MYRRMFRLILLLLQSANAILGDPVTLSVGHVQAINARVIPLTQEIDAILAVQDIGC